MYRLQPATACAVNEENGGNVSLTRRAFAQAGLGATISACACPAGTEVFLKVEGSSTRDVRLEGMDLANAKQPVEFGEGVPADAVAWR